jgi:peptidoglycan/LPS O-acetylase OafA/YrhL
MRLSQIDFLRGLAVLLVLFRHADFLPITMRVGWSGVDLFFVLSGFLVSGLLFDEYKKTNTVNPLLFLTRRGFKIYPLFFLLNAVVLGLALFTGVQYTNSQVMAELFFFQNYQQGLNSITWSLAVEEHFYILLIAGVYLAVRTRRIEDRRGFHILALIVMSYCLLARCANNIVYNEFNVFTHCFPTHLRIDALLFGVVLAYNYHFNGAWLKQFVLARKQMLVTASIICLAPIALFEVEGTFINTLGHTLAYLGFGGFLLLFIYCADVVAFAKRTVGVRFFNTLSYIGFYSYSIYLFHMLLHTYLHRVMYDYLGWDMHFRTYFVFYFGASIVLGIYIGKFIEMPVLKIREKLFPKYKPSRSSEVLPQPSNVQPA